MCLYYKFMKSLARRIFPRPKFVYEEEPAEGEPCVYLSNHAGAIGPVYAALYFKEPKKIWLIHYIMERKKNVKYIYHDFFNAMKKKHQFGWRLLARIVSILLTPLLEKTPHIEVYHDSRVRDTLRESVEALQAGEDIVIFPECPTRFTPYVNSFYSGFAELGRSYYGATGKKLKFYPTYVNKELMTVAVGKPIEYDPTVPAKKQREEIAERARDAIQALAESLPEHKPQPFLTEEWYDCYGQYADNPAEYFKLFE